MAATNEALPIFVVVPCFNEERRLKPEAYLNALDSAPELRWVFVNDGSSDRTFEVLERLQKTSPAKIFVVDYKENQGKGEAVRRGLNFALDQGALRTGYFDADLATPISELLRLIAIQDERSTPVVMGSRVFLLGRRIERKLWRFVLGRVFALVASRIVRLQVYDTQAGIKLIQVNPGLKQCVRDRFLSSWLFDVELIRRLMARARLTPDDFYEEPLRQWSDVVGSKVKFRSLLTALWDLWKIALAPQRQIEQPVEPKLETHQG